VVTDHRYLEEKGRGSRPANSSWRKPELQGKDKPKAQTHKETYMKKATKAGTARAPARKAAVPNKSMKAVPREGGG
jgi:hypothetical protein